MPVDVLQHDNSVIDNQTHAQRQPTECHDIQCQPTHAHDHKSHHDRDRDGAADDKRGYKRLESPENKILHPKTKIHSGVLEEACGRIVKDVFVELRKK